MSHIAMQTPEGLKKVRAAEGPDEIDTPIHHSDPRSLTSLKACPNSVANYAAGDLIGEAANVVHEFDIGALGFESVLLSGAKLSRKAIAVTAPRFRVWIHDGPLVTLTNADDAAHPLLWANALTRRGWIDFTSPIAGDAAGGDQLEYLGVVSNQQGLTLRPADGIIRALVTTRDAYARVALEAFLLQLDLVA